MSALVIILSFLFAGAVSFSAYYTVGLLDEGWSSVIWWDKILGVGCSLVFFIPICFLYNAVNIVWFHSITLGVALILLGFAVFFWIDEGQLDNRCKSCLLYGSILLALSLVAYFVFGSFTEDSKTTYFIIMICVGSLALVFGLLGLFSNWRVGLIIVVASLIFGSFAFLAGFRFSGKRYDYEPYYTNSEYMSSKSGVTYDSNNSYYSGYDYDDDGAINQKEWEDALGDYMDDLMGY